MKTIRHFLLTAFAGSVFARPLRGRRWPFATTLFPLAVGALLALFGPAPALQAANNAGALDTTFGSGGQVTTDLRGVDDQAVKVVVQPNGRIVVAGTSWNGSSYDFAVVRYMENGMLDTSFGVGGKVISNVGSGAEVIGLGLQSDGKIVVAGNFIAASGYGRCVVARYSTLGVLDPSFGTEGTGLKKFIVSLPQINDENGNPIHGPLPSGGDHASSMIVLADNRIFLFGYTYDLRVDRLYALFTMLGTDGLSHPCTISGMERTENNTFLYASNAAITRHVTGIGGVTMYVKPSNNEFVTITRTADLNQQGDYAAPRNVVITYSDSGIEQSQGDNEWGDVEFYATSVIVGSDNALLGGDFDGVAAFKDHLNPTKVPSIGTNSEFRGIVAQTGGGFVAAGTSEAAFAVARFAASHQLDASFGTSGLVTTTFAAVPGPSAVSKGMGMAVQSDGNIVVVGYNGIPGSGNRKVMALARYLSSATPEVTAPTVTNVGTFTATLGGTVNGVAINERGVVYSYSGGGNGVTKATASGTTGAFTVNVGSLAGGTTYSFKAYATNSQGTSYSPVMTFTTLVPQAPTVTTYISSNVSKNGASLYGYYTSAGSGSITNYGIVYAVNSVNADPRIGGASVTNLSSSGDPGAYNNFSGVPTTLAAGTTYAFRAYASNAFGTSYGSVATFTTVANAVNVVGGQFESPVTSSFIYGPEVTSTQGWTFSGNSGIAVNVYPGFGVTGFPYGQYAFMQRGGSISQQVIFPTAGIYSIRYRLAGRDPASGGGGDANYTVTISGGLYSDSGAVQGSAAFSGEGGLHRFTVTTPGTYTLTFTNTTPSGDNTFYVDEVSITRVPTASSQSGKVGPEDTTIALVLTGTDPDGDALWIQPGGVTHGSTSSQGNNVWYVPDWHYQGTDSINFYVTDSYGANSDPVTIPVAVTPVNDAPSITLPAGSVTGPAGVTWTPCGSGSRLWKSIASSANGARLAAVHSNGPIYFSSDFGATWSAPLSSPRDFQCITSSADGSKLAAVKTGQIYITTDYGATWTTRETVRFWKAITSSGDGMKLAAVTSAYGQIYTSTDAGVSWTPRESDRQWQAIACATDDGTKLVAAVDGGQLYTSTNSGVTWTARETNRSWRSVASSANGMNLAAVAYNGFIYTSTDAGVNWTQRASSRSWEGIASSSDGTKLVATVKGPGQIYTSTDAGVTWTARESNREWGPVASSADGSRLVAGASAGDLYTSAAPAAYVLPVVNSVGATTMTGFAAVSAGPANETDQTVSLNVTNTNNALFTTQPAISSNGTLTFTPNPALSGTATVTVTAQDNGGTANGGVNTSPAQTFTINVTAPPGPEIALTGNSVNITDGDSTPSTGDFTDFGSIATASGTVVSTFTIANSGGAALTLGNVTVGGTHASDFSITAQPAASVAAAGSTTFQVTFNPSANGLRSATLSFTNNDSDENPFDFSIQGTGLNTAPTAIALSATSISENNAANATVGTLSATDADTADVLAFSLVNGTGSTDNASFTIVGTALKLTPSANYEAKSSYAIRIGVNDGQGGTFESPFSITITDVLEAPTVTSIAPSTGRELGNTSVTITGTSFSSPATVSIGGNPATSVNVVNATTITAVTPAGSVGTASVVVTTPAGSNATNTLFTYFDPVVPANFASATDIPVPATSYTATGKTVNITLSYAPTTGTTLTIIKNTGAAFISGAFDNLAQGQAVALTYSGTTYNFVANYFGGTGNDLVLTWAGTRVMGWGNNNAGQLGNATVNFANSSLPVNAQQSGVLSGKTVIATATGTAHSMALCSDGTLAAWGRNTEGQLGNGGTTDSNVPMLVPQTSGALLNKTVIGIAAGYLHSAALCSDGTVVTWGYNGSGQLGNNSAASQSATPVAVNVANGTSALHGKAVVAIASGLNHCLALCSDGTMASWGNNAEGELGNGTQSNSNVPVPVGTSGVLLNKSVTTIAAGQYFCLALCSDGALAAWGSNSFGQLGNSGSGLSTTPVAVVQGNGVLLNKTVTAVTAGGYHCMALCSDGTLAAWGYNSSGQLGIGNQFNASAPTAVQQASGALLNKTVTAIGAGDAHSLALCSDGTLTSWGRNVESQLGTGNTAQSTTPVAVLTTTLAAGERFTKTSSGAYVQHTLCLIASPPPSAPEIAVTGNTVDIADGDSTPSTTDFTDFGSIATTGATQVRTFTINNLGNAALTLGSVTLGGTHAADFSVTTQPAASVATAGTTTFQITFNPSANGLRSATLSFGNNDADENPFNFSIQGTGLNSAPTAIALTVSSIQENNVANATVGTLSDTDVDTADVPTFSLISGTGSTDNASFTIVGTALKLTPIANYEVKSSYAIRIGVNDGQGGTFESPFTITITNQNEAPTALALSANTLTENALANSNVGTLSTTDVDAGDTFTYTLVTGPGSTDNAVFTLSGNALRLTASPDFETKSSYSVRVSTTDAGGLSFENSFTITITNVNELPSFTKGGNPSHPFATSGAQTVSTWATAIYDGDSTVAQTLSFNITVTSGSSIFSSSPAVNSGTGTLTYTLNGTSGTASISVTMTDDASINATPALTTAAQTFTITVAPASTAQTWAQANGVSGDLSLPGANGVPNLLNFAFGMTFNMAPYRP